MPDPPPQLPYGDLPTQWGVSLERDERCVRISVPPLPRFWSLPVGAMLGGAYLGFSAAVMGGMILSQQTKNEELFPMLTMMLLYASAFVAICMYAYRRLRWRTIFEVTPSRFTVSEFDGTNVRGGRSWHRTQIVETKFNAFSGMLLVRIQAQDFVEFFISPDKDVARWVAEQITGALQTITPEIKQELISQPIVNSPVQPPAKGASRKALAALSVLPCLFALGMMIFGPAFYGLSCFIAFLAAAPAGIAFGSQKKDYYFY